MGEVVEGLLILVIGIPVILAMLVFGFFLYLALGWIVILAWLIMGMPTSEPFFGLVMLSMLVYGLAGLMLLLKPDLTGLPPALKFLAQIVPAPLQRQPNGQVDLPNLALRSRDRLLSPFTNLEKKFQTLRHRKAADALEVDTEYQEAQAEVHRKAQAYNRAKLRAEEAERARRQHGKR